MPTMNFWRPLCAMSVLAGCVLCGSGCGGSTEKIVSVSGKVTHKGQPVSGIVVSFVPQAATQTGVSTGETDQNGQYELKVSKTGWRGAVVGTHKVWVSLPREPTENHPPPDKEERNMAKKDRKKKANAATERQPADIGEILKKYGNADKTQLTVEVKGDPIDLQLD
jgi:hypothetical protein